MNDRTDIDVAAMRARLERRREELQHLTEAASGSRRPVELDQTRVGRLSRMDALQSQAMSIETERRRQVELRRIEAALDADYRRYSESRPLRFNLAYAAGRPDISYEALDPVDSYESGRYTDKLILGWRYSFSDDAIIRISISQEVSEGGFGGGAVQYQMFF